MESVRKTALEGAALDQLSNGFQSEGWMAVMVSLKDGVLTLHKTTCNFPFGDFDNTVKMLKESLDRETGVKKPDPLPLASHLEQSPEPQFSPAIGPDGEYYGPTD